MTPTQPYYAVLQAQMDSLGLRMDSAFGEIKTLLVGYDMRLRDLEKSNIRVDTATGINMGAAWKRIDENAAQIEALKVSISDLRESSKRLNEIFRWMLGVFTVIFTSGLLLFISGKATIVFK